MTEVILIRPGATLYDEQHRIQGVLDIPLSEQGRRQVEDLAERLTERQLTALYYGPGDSVEQTAAILGLRLALKPRLIDELHNLDQGLWQGLCVEEIKRRHARVFRQWVEAPDTVCPPQGETIDQARERLKAALKPILKRHRDETFGLIVPEPLARIVACHLRQAGDIQLEETPPTATFEAIAVDPGLCRNGRAS